jgi:hypothetical protein
MKAMQKVNIMFWLVLAVVLMVTAYCKWEHYNFLSFLVSLFFHGGFCALGAYLVNRHITREPVYKTFDDLEWNPWTTDEHYSQEFLDSRQAKMTFSNGYGVSVLCGTPFYSNGEDSYEVGIMKYGELFKLDRYDDTVIGYRTKDEVTNIMKYLQTLK